MSRTRALFYDDTVPVPSDIRGLIGLERFGALLFDRSSLADHVLRAAKRAGFARITHLKSAADRLRSAEQLEQGKAHEFVVYLTADAVCDLSELDRELARVSFAEIEIWEQPTGSDWTSGLAVLKALNLGRLLRSASSDERRDWFRESRPGLELSASQGLVSLKRPEQLVRFLSGTFYTRSFNRIESDGRVLTKRSEDRQKLLREHDYWYLLPPSLQRFVVQPFDYAEDKGGASYKMEYLTIADFATMWIHGASTVDRRAFEGLLDGIFGWFAERGTKRVSPEIARARAEQLYVTKVQQRVARFLSTDIGAKSDALIAAGTRFHGGLEEVLARYMERLSAAWARRPPVSELAIMHGDLCFSNVLFDKRTQFLRFVDPRGASSEDELWGNPYYDLAKLSHSVLGAYDVINHELFDVIVGPDQSLQLKLDVEVDPSYGRAFVARVQAAGFEVDRMRLYEASLFLSMLPLHIDSPRKVLAFAVTAVALLE
ncbi:MAG: hypothetical protein EA397_20290 [Deltaproteobacteria bacterium]|nr:MAG: hypothetical protein EA397_20290 [Deltaproteobacteria bacterium]